MVMNKWAYYNEIDPFAAAWLRKLIEAGHVADGEVDERDIRDVHPADLRGFAQVHMFAGIGGWSRALRLADWGDDRPVWTGSCPCQPFSQAGRGGGVADERHLWPHFHHLINECRPGRVYGEQVSSPDGLAWFDLVQTDLEGSGYAAAALDICAASVGAPHIRQRLYWMADAESGGRGDYGVLSQAVGGRQDTGQFELFGAVGGLGQPAEQGPQRQQDRRYDVYGQGRSSVERASGESVGRVEDGRRPSPTNGFWADPDWLFCRDGKWRPVEPGTFVLASGFPNRMGLLRGFGNAIVPPLAAEFIKATM
jgi:DNA (cytosine-5)-methyltransferase 1